MEMPIEKTPQNVKILIIDDDELIRMTLKSIVKKTGYQVFEAKNGTEGLALFIKEKPDIVITDMLMPDKEGFETIADIRSISPQTKIIAISGGGSTKNMSFLQLAKQVGADHTLSKPVKPDTLLLAIKTLLAG